MGDGRSKKFTEVFVIRLTPEMYASLVKHAKENDRSLAQTVRYSLRKQLGLAVSDNKYLEEGDGSNTE